MAAAKQRAGLGLRILIGGFLLTWKHGFRRNSGEQL